MRSAVPKHHTIDYVEFAAPNLGTAKEFYAGAFGWSFNEYGPEYAGIVEGDGEAGGLSTFAPEGTAPLPILYSDNLDASLDAVKQAGGTITQEPFDFPGGRRFHFEDPAGNALAVWTTKSD